MFLMDEIPYMKLFSSNRRSYIPFDPSDRKKGAAIMLLTRSPVDSTNLMNLPFMINPNLFNSLYIDRNVNAYIDSGAIVDDEGVDEGEAVNEAMIHTVRAKSINGKHVTINIKLLTSSKNDEMIVKSFFKDSLFSQWYTFFGTKQRNIPDEINIYVYPDVKTMAKTANKEAISNGEIVLNSYSNHTSIYVVAPSGYRNIKSAEGDNYEAYLLNEVITQVCMNTSKNCSRYMACQVATALSGQLTEKIMYNIENNWSDVKDNKIAVAYYIKKLYEKEGPKAIKYMVRTGDYFPLVRYAGKSFIKRISGLYLQEATLTAAQRKNIPDSDYGLPSQKKYPMPDESHVRSAIRFFNHVDPSDEAELARNIKKKIKQYGLDVNVGKENRFSKYYQSSDRTSEKKKSSKNESALLEAGLSFKTAKNLSDWMKKNIKYKNYTSLMSADEVYSSKQGSCHDQVVFELKMFKMIPETSNCRAWFVFEHDGKGQGGETHSYVTYKKDGKLYWFENAWTSMAGIHEIKDNDEFFRMHKAGKWGNVSKFPEIEIASFKAREGMSLQQLVDSCLTEGALLEFDWEPDKVINRSNVYFTREITPESLIKIYKALNISMEGKVAVKISTGEPGKGPRYCLNPQLIGPFVKEVDGTIVECNVAYEGLRHTSEEHWKTIKKHGYYDIAPCDILDEEGDYTIPVEDGLVLDHVLGGTHMKNYDSFVILSHFKGHAMGGYGGALKNVAIGLSSADGKKIVHSGGHVTDKIAGMNDNGEMDSADKPVHDLFLKSMADANKAFKKEMGDRVIYINVANNISVDCDCNPEPHAPTMKDLGVFASTDPVAVDQACIDAVYAAPDSDDVIHRIEERHGLRTLDYALQLKLGNRDYNLIDIDEDIKETTKIREQTTLNEVKFENNEGKKVPKICPKCRSKVGVYFAGEPIFRCSNKDCNKYFGTVPFRETVLLEADRDLTNKERNDISEIINSFSNEDKEQIGQGNFLKFAKNYPYVDIKYQNGKPIAFICALYSKEGKNAFIMLGVKEDYRGKGISKELAKKMVNYFNSNKNIFNFNNLEWNSENEASSKVAKSVGFKLVSRNDKKETFSYKFKSNINEAKVGILGGNKLMNLDRFVELKADWTTIDRFKDSYGALKHLRTGNNCEGRIYIDRSDNREKVVGFYNIETKDDGTRWLQALEVNPDYQDQGIGTLLLEEAIRDGATHLAVKKGNDKAKRIYVKHGFKTYASTDAMDMMKTESVRYKIPLPVRTITESFNEDGYICTDDYIMNENFITFFNGMDTQVISEAEKKFDARLRRYLFTQRLKNNKMVLTRYQEMKAMSPWIQRTYLKLPMYRGRNIFIDLSYYHGLFLNNLRYTKDKAIAMYWDFINRIINDSEYKNIYKKITIFIPVYPDAWDTNNPDELMDYKKSINPISMIIRMLRRNPDALKAWGNKDIVFISPKGYFKVNFNTFQFKDMPKFKRFIKKLVTYEDIVDDAEEDGYTDNSKEVDSPGAITASIVDKIEKNTGVKIDDITGDKETSYEGIKLDDSETKVFDQKPQFDHLRIRTDKIKLPSAKLKFNINNKEEITNSNTIFIMAPNDDETIESLKKEFMSNGFKLSKEAFYTP